MRYVRIQNLRKVAIIKLASGIRRNNKRLFLTLPISFDPNNKEQFSLKLQNKFKSNQPQMEIIDFYKKKECLQYFW